MFTYFIDDAVRPETENETKTFASIAELIDTKPSKIASRWREPSLTVHSVTTSGSNSTTYFFSLFCAFENGCSPE